VLILRPIERDDLEDLILLAKMLDSMNLPSDRPFLQSRIEHSLRTFAGELGSDETGLSVFVLDDLAQARVVGTSMIIHKHGTPALPYYWFEVSSEERRSVELDKRFVHQRLRLRHSEDGPTEIGGLILDPGHRRHPEKCGKALSVVRFAYMSLHPQKFEREVIAEMLSPFEASGENLLWEAFGRHFTGLTYQEADHLSSRDKRFIADLFPRETVYATLFPDNVQSAIGEPGETAKAALRILEKVGFQYLNQVDPFDGGPYFGAARDAITSVAERRELVLPGTSRSLDTSYEGPLALLSCEAGPGFRATVIPLDADDAPIVSGECREALGVKGGDRVLVTPLP
jgi:arginine N-succinyltransferase